MRESLLFDEERKRERELWTTAGLVAQSHLLGGGAGGLVSNI
jgi:hypothetical protein